MIVWEKGGEARVLEAKGEQVVLRSTVPYPPGAPVPGALRTSSEGDEAGASHGFVVKVSGSKKVSPTEWDVQEQAGDRDGGRARGLRAGGGRGAYVNVNVNVNVS